jgi:hypothetical protein
MTENAAAPTFPTAPLEAAPALPTGPREAGSRPAPTPRQEPDPPRAWTEHLLGTAGPPGTSTSTATWGLEAQRFGTAIALASLFGVALGLRLGGPAIATHAVGVSLGILGVCMLAVPALAILLALANAPIDALGLARATSRAAATAGLVLAGLAPGAALFAVTVEDAISVTLVGVGGLLLASALGMRSFVRELAPQLGVGDARARRLSRLTIPLFLVFAGVLGARIWWVMLPIVRGA